MYFVSNSVWIEAFFKRFLVIRLSCQQIDARGMHTKNTSVGVATVCVNTRYLTVNTKFPTKLSLEVSMKLPLEVSRKFHSKFDILETSWRGNRSLTNLFFKDDSSFGTSYKIIMPPFFQIVKFIHCS